MAEHTTFGLDPGKLARLLSLGADPDLAAGPQAAETAVAEVLRGRLDGPLPLEAEEVEALPVLLGRPPKQMLPEGGRPVVQLLVAADAPLPVLERIKDYGKRLAGARRPGAQHAAGTAVYFAAIAAALLRCDTRITRHTYASLTQAFARLVAEPWMAPELVDLFLQGRDLCQRRAAAEATRRPSNP